MMSKPASELHKQYRVELDQDKPEALFYHVYAKSFDELYRMFGENLIAIEEMPFSATDRDDLKCPSYKIWGHPEFDV